MPIYSSPQSPPTATAVSPGAMTAAQNNSLNGLSANVVNAMMAPYYASGDGRATTTVGTTATGTAATLTADIGLSTGQGVFIAGAGAAGVDYIGTVVSCVGTELVVTPATSTSVSAGAVVRHDSSVAVQAAIDDVYAITMATRAAGRSCGGGTVLLDGLIYINGAFQDPSGANSILKMPTLEYSAGMQAVDIKLKGSATPTFTDQGASVGGAILQTHKTSTGVFATAGSMIAGYCATSTWQKFTACFLTVEDVTFRAPTDPSIHGINAYNIGRLTGNGMVVVDTVGNKTFPMSSDTAAVICPAFNCVPPSNLNSVTVKGFQSGLLGYERTHISYLYVSRCALAIQPSTGSLTIDNVVVDIATTVVSSSGMGGAIKIGMAALDQCDTVLYDPSNTMIGDITYTRGSGTMVITGGSGILCKLLGKSTTAFAPAGGNTVAKVPNSNDVIHTFTSSGTFVCNKTGTVRVLVVPGGGAGMGYGPESCGSGGAGGAVVENLSFSASGTLTVTVGAGGVGNTGATQYPGGNSVFGSITGTGGAGGSVQTSSPPCPGGAGAGGAGGAGAGSQAGAGGVGVSSDITGTATYYGGGGGGGFTLGGAGGNGGGGRGDNYNAANGAAGTPLTGGGGGGVAGNAGSQKGYNGGSGVVYVRYSPQ